MQVLSQPPARLITRSRASPKLAQVHGSDVFQGERRTATFFARGTASPLQKKNVGERCSPWQGLNMSEVQ
jgi:hypothetical protein